ncbi:Protein sel-1-like 1 [Porphyridium purpureum]|uniref:Protein sel-1-like 1 n=1 Tax=Porphyridium purpureum TaxID=35688 RepID=A0A5J4YRX8_PORPP|nr:Protein sel-1-like 1 [Porphyridium purpureum]|eukprot:POR3342..scf229_5
MATWKCVPPSSMLGVLAMVVVVSVALAIEEGEPGGQRRLKQEDHRVGGTPVGHEPGVDGTDGTPGVKSQGFEMMVEVDEASGLFLDEEQFDALAQSYAAFGTSTGGRPGGFTGPATSSGTDSASSEQRMQDDPSPADQHVDENLGLHQNLDQGHRLHHNGEVGENVNSRDGRKILVDSEADLSEELLEKLHERIQIRRESQQTTSKDPHSAHTEKESSTEKSFGSPSKTAGNQDESNMVYGTRRARFSLRTAGEGAVIHLSDLTHLTGMVQHAEAHAGRLIGLHDFVLHFEDGIGAVHDVVRAHLKSPSSLSFWVSWKIVQRLAPIGRSLFLAAYIVTPGQNDAPSQLNMISRVAFSHVFNLRGGDNDLPLGLKLAVGDQETVKQQQQQDAEAWMSMADLQPRLHLRATGGNADRSEIEIGIDTKSGGLSSAEQLNSIVDAALEQLVPPRSANEDGEDGEGGEDGEDGVLEDGEAEALYEEAVEMLLNGSDFQEALALLRTVAKLGQSAGSTGAHATLAGIYLFGDVAGEVESDLTVAKDHATVAAELGDADSHFLLAFLARLELHSKPDHDNPEMHDAKMILHLVLAAQGGNVFAKSALGFAFQHGMLVKKSCAPAALLYEQAAARVLGFDEHSTESVEEMSEELERRIFERGVRLQDDDLLRTKRRRLALLRRQRGSANSGSAKEAHSEDFDIMDYYRLSAANGDVGAQVALGQAHYFGLNGVQPNHELARDLFHRAARAGSAVAHTSLGYIYTKMKERSINEAAPPAGSGSTFGAAQSEQQAGAARAQSHAEGKNGSASDVRAFFHFEQAAKYGDPAGHNGLGYCYLHGIGVARNETRAFMSFMKAAEHGLAEGMYNTGVMYLEGVGTEPNAEKALGMFLSASKKGHTYSMYQAGVLLRRGREEFVKRPGSSSSTAFLQRIPADCERALPLLKAVTEQGEVFELISVAEDAFWEQRYAYALRRYLEAAFAGSELGQFNAAFLMMHGLGVEEVFGAHVNTARDLKIREHARDLFLMSSMQGYSLAMTKVGHMHYRDGMFEEAAHAYRISADSGSAESMFTLGTMHALGMGVAQDDALAKRYFDMTYLANVDAFIASALASFALRAVPPKFRLVALELAGQFWSPISDYMISEYLDLLVLVLLLGVLIALAVVLRRRAHARAVTATQNENVVTE